MFYTGKQPFVYILKILLLVYFYSPREAHTPTSFPSQFMNIMKKHEGPVQLKLTEDHFNWRDEDGNSIFHYAAWTGNIYLARALFESARGRNLIETANNKGATPVAMAIIACQDKMVEEFFMNKKAQKSVDLKATLKDSQETIAHLLLQYAPFVNPKFLLKRKDLTRELLNSVDKDGNTPLLHVASRNNVHTVNHILTSKTVKDGKMLDLSLKNRFGKTILHYLVENRDEENFRLLLDREELTEEVANIPDNEGQTPMIYCITKGSPYMARDIFLHSTAKTKFRLDLSADSSGRSALHLVAKQGNAPLWNLAIERPDCDFTARDNDGNTPLMSAVVLNRVRILEAWLRNKEKAKSVDLTLVNKEGKTLVMLFIEHLTSQYLKVLLSTVDAKHVINHEDKNGDSALLLASKLGKWDMVRELLINNGLKIGQTEEDMEGTVDVHARNRDGLTALTLQMQAHIKLERSEQTYTMKKQRVLAAEAKKEREQVWELIKLMLKREQEQHGTSAKEGKDGGSECIKVQFSAGKSIRPQAIDEVVQEFVKLYNFVKRKKPPSIVPAKAAVQEPGAQPTVVPPKPEPQPIPQVPEQPKPVSPPKETVPKQTESPPKEQKQENDTENSDSVVENSEQAKQSTDISKSQEARNKAKELYLATQALNKQESPPKEEETVPTQIKEDSPRVKGSPEKPTRKDDSHAQINGKAQSNGKQTDNEIDDEESPPTAPARRIKKRMIDVATQTKPWLQACTCCCTCDKSS